MVSVLIVMKHYSRIFQPEIEQRYAKGVCIIKSSKRIMIKAVVYPTFQNKEQCFDTWPAWRMLSCQASGQRGNIHHRHRFKGSVHF